MIEKYYKILNLTLDASNEEIELAYKTLTQKYKAERFEEGVVGNEAARKLTEIETAYKAILDYKNQSYSKEQTGNLFEEIEALLKADDLTSAQQKLDSFDERNAEWHYLQSVVFYKKNWLNESKKQLEIAVDMAPNVSKYSDALKKMVDSIEAAAKKQTTNSSAYTSGSTYQSGSGARATLDDDYGEEQQLGGSSCFEWCCQMLACNLLLNCCCNCS